MPYMMDQATRVYSREERGSFSYSDGETAEMRLLTFLRGVSDRGTFSREIRAGIHDWPTEYHLSLSRHHLLKPLPIRSGDRVLELGCGCGALTRYLGEIGAAVTAVEGSWTRACIAAERCRDLPNVRVVCDNLLKYEGETGFDWVLLIGVLEYAPVYSGAPDPVQHYLQAAKQQLSSDGRLVVAIENRLGLKYFNGCTEDHVGVVYFGLQDLYSERTPVTFGRSELIDQLGQAGFNGLEFYYPFPDYKTPQVIFAEAAFTHQPFRPADMLLRMESRDYSGQKIRRNFSEPLVARTLDKNGLLRELANSFLTVASRDRTRPETEENLAWTFSSQRMAELLTETVFYVRQGVLRVEKRRAAHMKNPESLRVAGLSIRHQELESEYVFGRQCAEAILKTQTRTADWAKIADAFLPWLQYLRSQTRLRADAEGKRLGDWLLDGCQLDCTPDNLLVTDGAAGTYREIDQEWCADGDIPLGWVVVRGVIHNIVFKEPTRLDVAGVVLRLCAKLNLDCTGEEIYEWIKMEDELQTALSGHSASSPGVSDRLRLRLRELFGRHN